MPLGIERCFASATQLPLAPQHRISPIDIEAISPLTSKKSSFHQKTHYPSPIFHLDKFSNGKSNDFEIVESYPQISSSPSSLVLALLTEELSADSFENLASWKDSSSTCKEDDDTSHSCGSCLSYLCCLLHRAVGRFDLCCQHFLENLQPAAGLSEHETSNYLYNRSREIEPKNCKKPPFKERRWPNIPLKSPGIKPRSSRSVPNPLPSMFGSGHKTGDGGPDGEETPHHLTPPTPSTPGTPPASANPADNSIFATVEIGQGALAFGRHEYRGSISSSSYSHGNTSVPPTPIATNPPLPPPPYTPSSLSAGIPPPLPPRRKREPSLGDTSPKVKQAPDAPELPPRDASPPPIPPRAATTTLPRMHSSSALSNTHHPCPPPPYPIHQHSSGSLASIPSSVFSGVSSSLHHLHLHQHHTTPFHHHNVPFCGAPPHLQYRLDPPPQRRRTSSMDLTSPGSATHRSSTNGPHSGISSSSMEPSLSDSPPPPPPRLSTRIPAAFTYDHHNL